MDCTHFKDDNLQHSDIAQTEDYYILPVVEEFGGQSGAMSQPYASGGSIVARWFDKIHIYIII